MTPFVIVAVAGVVVAAFLNRAIRRLPLGKSVCFPFWEHCEVCYARMPNSIVVPVLGWFLVCGRCPNCRARWSARGLLVTLVTVLGFLGLYWMHVYKAGRFLPRLSSDYVSWDHHKLTLLFTYHAILFSFLVAATFTDFDWKLIPDAITVPGMFCGVGLAVLWHQQVQPIDPWMHFSGLRFPYYFEHDRWTGWFGRDGQLAPWLESIRSALHDHWWFNWNRYIALVGSLLGLLAGGGIVWIVRLVASNVFRREAMGLGDVTLMMMVGSFLGWQ
ncbi:MAG TPA: prepilin peptidase, partial [Planctomycetia bacterium]|nr:prepilin peptidase [Planctomycetia bacterium]